ncbi:SRPBCC family protein [Stagnihabitans tardus]|uniref:SRPBCC family protein n=1 Tax=Stagnihabitans tardus TaxID=2699202 RepID=A0AAE5BW18_9RHOB|nr:SRPBCC family protein [Stagnihabitans tardus]NBZ89556.1 SRPBCC family protein [Stagnihabitans tardus]
MTHLRKRLLLSLAAALFYAGLGYLVIWAVPPGDSMPFFAGLVLLPMGLASVATTLANPHGDGGAWGEVKRSWIVLGAAILLSAVVFGEGILCLVIASPVLGLFSALGAILTHALLRRLAPASVAGVFCLMPFVLLPLEPYLSWQASAGRVVTVIEIDAPPAEVWRHTVEIPQIDAEALPWTISHDLLGLPQPIDARLPPGSGVRQLRWTRGIAFQEVITDWQENRALSWTFRFDESSIPDEIDRHIQVESRYLHLEGGGYVLEPLGQGTRLTLTTDYVVTSPLNFYFKAWGDLMLNDFHHAVLTVIKARAEG